MTNKKTVSKQYAQKQFTSVGLVLIVYALLVLYIPLGIKQLAALEVIPFLNDKDNFLIVCLICLISGSVFPFFALRKAFGIELVRFKNKPQINIGDYLINYVVYFGFVAAALYLNTIIFELIGFQGSIVSDIGVAFNDTLNANTLYLIIYIVISPILEEYAFRGVLLNCLSKYGRFFALIMTSIIYALAHGSISEIFPSLIMGYLLGKMMLNYGSIWPSIITHILANGFLYLLALIPENDAYISIIILGVVIVAAIIFVVSKHYKVVSVKNSKANEKVSLMFLSNIFVIISLVLFIAHTLLVMFVK